MLRISSVEMATSGDAELILSVDATMARPTSSTAEPTTSDMAAQLQDATDRMATLLNEELKKQELKQELKLEELKQELKEELLDEHARLLGGMEGAREKLPEAVVDDSPEGGAGQSTLWAIITHRVDTAEGWRQGLVAALWLIGGFASAIFSLLAGARLIPRQRALLAT